MKIHMYVYEKLCKYAHTYVCMYAPGDVWEELVNTQNTFNNTLHTNCRPSDLQQQSGKQTESETHTYINTLHVCMHYINRSLNSNRLSLVHTQAQAHKYTYKHTVAQSPKKCSETCKNQSNTSTTGTLL